MMALQATLLGAGVWFLAASARRNWATLGRFDLAPAPLPLAAASLLTAATWILLVGIWARSLTWWQPPQHLAMRPALRIWFITNLARYIPGTVWQFAGLAALSAGQGVSPVAATGAVLLQQVALLATGAGVTVALAPKLAQSWGAALPAAVVWAMVGGLVAAGAVLVPAAGRMVRRLASRVAGRDIPWPEPSSRELAGYVSALTLPWLAYGLSFWWFGRALLGPDAPGLVLSMGAFTGSYVAGILAVAAPGGIVVREAALVAALSPAIGGDGALLLAVASRAWLVALELVTALPVLVWSRPATSR